MDTILGIDLGTTNSVVSIFNNGTCQILEEDGQKIVPSVVGLDANANLLVGFPALNQAALAPERTVRSIKRKMGSDETILLGNQAYAPQEISAIILRTLKDRAARQMGREIRKAVITVPAFFHEQQREATRAAGELAGLDVVRIINEPTAASLTYNPHGTGLERLLVYDLGGGTFDVSIVQIEEGVVEVLASHGDTQLGGDDFDQLLLDHVCGAFKEQHDVDPRESLVSKSRLLCAVEEAKKRLSFDAYALIEEEFIAEKSGVPLHLKTELARIDYEALIEPLLNKTLVCVDEALSDAKLTADKIDRVVLVGGASRTPLVRRLLSEQLGQPIHAEVDPDLCVSMGAAIQGGLIAGADVGPVLVDITPHTLGIACEGWLHSFRSQHRFAPLIHRNTPLPASRSEVFRTLADGQHVAAIEVYQGEDEDARHNEQIGDFKLEGLADVKAGNKVLVRFDLDLDGILTVVTTEKATGLEKRLKIENVVSPSSKLERNESQARVEAAFGNETASEPESPDQNESFATADDNLPPQWQQAIAQAEDLIAKTDLLAAEAAPQDANEMQQLVQRLRQAIEARSAEEVEQISAKLDDLVFYLQDV
ncbi:MAG: Hsp70 family protein [Pirellulales bacterium]